MKLPIVIISYIIGLVCQLSADTPAFGEGEITLSKKAGEQIQTTRFLKKDGKLRIDMPGQYIPATPINLVDLKTGSVSVLRPHNSSWSEVPADRLKPRTISAITRRPGPPPPPPGIGAPPTAPAGIPTPTLPQAHGVPGLLAMPSTNLEMKLQVHEETRTIHGYQCQRHTISIPRCGEMTLWLCDAADLPPFHTLIANTPRNEGRVEWTQQWTALVRAKKLFSMLAVLRATKDPQDIEIIRWEITSISAKPIKDPGGKLFAIPKEFLAF